MPGAYCKTTSFSAERSHPVAHDKPTIYHNPRCSKSRETLQILEENKTAPEIVEYLKDPPDADELRRIIALLGIPARELQADWTG